AENAQQGHHDAISDYRSIHDLLKRAHHDYRLFVVDVLNPRLDRSRQRHRRAGTLHDKRHEWKRLLSQRFVHLALGFRIQAVLFGVAHDADDLPPSLRSIRDVDALADRVFIGKESRRKTLAHDGHTR